MSWTRRSMSGFCGDRSPAITRSMMLCRSLWLPSRTSPAPRAWSTTSQWVCARTSPNGGAASTPQSANIRARSRIFCTITVFRCSMSRGSSPGRDAARPRAAARRLVLGLAFIGNVVANAQAPEPDGYRLDDYRAPTPKTLAGGIVLDTATAYALWNSGDAAWIDVLPAPRRPANLPAAALWMPLPHRDIPGSLWLPDIGRSSLSPELEAYFRDNLAAVTKGRHDIPVVFYCLADCWMSWNAAKRALSWGYTRVYWYRDGTDGWEAAVLPTADAEPVPGP